MPTPTEEIQRIKAAVTLSRIVGETVELKREGTERVACCPFHNERTPSFKVNDAKGIFHCFGCGAQGDVFDWLARARGMPLPVALEYLGAEGRSNGNGKHHGGEPEWLPCLPPPQSADAPDLAGWDAVYTYRDEAGTPLFYVRRRDGGKRKTFLPLTFGSLDGTVGWHARHPFPPRPLYGLHRLPRHPGHPIIVCEGEKAADAAQQLFPNHACLSWCAGTGNVGKADWSPIAGRKVIIWPDNDAPGKAAAAEIAKLLPNTVTISVSDLPDKGDAADLKVSDPASWLAGKLKAREDDEAYTARPFTAANLSLLEPYDWIYQRLLISRFFCALGAPPGTGKTALIVAIAISIATGRALLGGENPEPGNVWIINLEDPTETIEKMVWACCQHYGIEPVDLEGRMFINSGRDKPLLVASLVDGAVLRMPVAGQLLDECRQRNIRALFIDPVVDTHNLPENDNISMNQYCSIWNDLAEQAELGILLSMHFRKGGQSGDQDAFRGASAVIGKARSAITLGVMSEADAMRLGVNPDLRRFHLRLDNAKQNLAPPPTKVDWLRLESVPLVIGDNIQTLRAWSPPSPWEGFSMDQAIQALEAIDTGPGAGEFYTYTKVGRGNRRWAGDIVVAHAENGMEPGLAIQILNQWLQSGLLLKGVYHSPSTRKEVSCVRVDPQKLAEMKLQTSPEPQTDNEG